MGSCKYEDGSWCVFAIVDKMEDGEECYDGCEMSQSEPGEYDVPIDCSELSRQGHGEKYG